MRSKSPYRQAGLNLVEVLVAALILSVGLLGLAGLQMSSLKSAQIASSRQHGITIVNELLERMRGNRQSALAGDYSQTTTCGSTAPAGCNQTSCSGADLAAYDIYSVLCGTGQTDQLAIQLLNSTMTINCPTGGDCSQGVRITLQWTERVEQSGIADGNAGELDTEDFTLQVNAII